MRVCRAVVGLAIATLAAMFCASCDSAALVDTAPERETSGVLSPATSLVGTVTEVVPTITINLRSSGTEAVIWSTQRIDDVEIHTDSGAVYSWTDLGLRYAVLQITDGSRIANVCARSGRGSKWFLDDAKWYQDQD